MDSRLLENDGKRGLLNLSPTFVTLVEKRGSILGFHRSLDSRIRENDGKGNWNDEGLTSCFCLIFLPCFSVSFRG